VADSSVLLEVIVEGKNIKLVQRDIEELGSSVNKTSMAEEKNTKAKKDNKKATDDLAAGSQNYNRGQKGVAGATANSTKAFSKQRDAIGGSNGLVAAYATVAATLFAATAAFGALRRASQVEQLESGLAALGATSGIAMRTLSTGLAEATGNAISLEQAMRSTAQIVSAGLDPSSIEEFGNAARNISVALGRNVTDSLDRLTRGISKLEPELLDELGLFVRVDEAVEKYAQSLGKSASELTNFERRIAFQNEALAQAEEKFGAIGDRVDVSPYDKLAASLTDLTKTVVTFISVAIEPLIGYLAQSPVALLGVIGALGGKVITQALGALIPLNVSLQSLGKLQKQAGMEIAQQLPKYTKQSKALKELSDSMRAGTSTFEQRDAALKEQVTNVKRATTRVQNLNKQQAAGVDVSKKLASAEVTLDNARKRQAGVSAIVLGYEQTLTKAKNQNTVATMLNYIAQGKFKKALGLAQVAMIRFSKLKRRMTRNTTGFTRVIKLAQINVIGFGRAVKATMLGIVGSIPIIGQIIVVLMVLIDVIKGVFNFFKSDATKRFEQNLSSAKDTINELSNATAELDKFFMNQKSSIASLSLAYTNLSNTLTTVASELNKLEGGDVGERLKLLQNFIKNSSTLEKIFKEQGIDVNNLKGSEAQRLALLQKGLAAAQNQANAVRGVAEAGKSVDEAFSKLRQSIAVTTPFTEVSKAVTDLVRNIENAKAQGQEGLIPQVITEQLGRKGALDLGLGSEFDQIAALNKEIENQQGIVEKNEKKGRGRENKQRKAQRESRQAAAREAIETAEKEKEALSAIFEERIKENAEALRNLDINLKSQKATESRLKSEISLAKRQENFTRTSIQNRIDLENSLKQSKIESNNLLLTENKRRKSTYDLDIKNAQERLANADAENLTAEERAGLQNTITDLTDEQRIVTAEINRLTAENADLQDSKIEGAEAELQIAQGAMKAVQLRQKYERAVNSELQKQLGFQKSIETAQIKIEKFLQQGTRQSLSGPEQVTFAKKEAKARIDAAVREFNLKAQMIELDYALLDAKTKLMKAEIAAEVQKNNLTQQEADNINALIDGLELGTMKTQALQAAAAGVAQTIVEGQMTVQKAIADAREQVLKDQRDYTDAFVKGAKKQTETLAELAKLNITNPFTGEIDFQFLGKAAELAETERQNKLAFLEYENSLTAQRIQDQIDADTARVDSMSLSAEGAKEAQQLELNAIERRQELLDQQKASMALEEQLLAKQFELQRLKEASEAIDKAAESGNAGAGLGAAAAIIAGIKKAAAEGPKQFTATEKALADISEKFGGQIPEAQLLATVEMKNELVAKLGELPTAIAEALKMVIPATGTGEPQPAIVPESGVPVTSAGTAEAAADPTAEMASISSDVSSAAAGAVAGAEAEMDVSPLQSARLLAQGFAADLRQLGPEGEAVAAFVGGGLALTDSLTQMKTNFEAAKTTGEKGAAVLNGIGSAIGAIGQMMRAQSDMAIAAIDKEIAAEKKKDGKSKESLAKIKQLEAKKEAMKKKAFEKDKKMKMAQTVINTAAAIMTTLGQTGFFGIPLAIIMGVMGAAQLAIISGMSYQGGSASPSVSGPSQVSVGERKNTVDLAKSQSASGELGYMRGQMGTGGPNNFKPAFMGAQYRAMGGSTTGYVVGEQGPELFVPDTPGTIVPNSQAETEGVPLNATFNINTIDASGVAEVLSDQQGNIIGMLREAANSYGQPFLEEVDTSEYTPTAGAQLAGVGG
jgi:hypothetical protein